MPQALLPLIPEGATPINERLSVIRERGEWTYLLGVHPVFSHDEADRRSNPKCQRGRMLCSFGCRIR